MQESKFLIKIVVKRWFYLFKEIYLYWKKLTNYFEFTYTDTYIGNKLPVASCHWLYAYTIWI